MEVNPPMARGVMEASAPPAHHHLGVAVPDVAEGVAHRIGAAGAGRHRADAHAVQSEADGDMAGRQVGDAPWG